MTTVTDLARDTLPLINGEFRSNIDVLATTIASGATEVVLTHDLWPIANGEYIEVNNEPMLVVDKNAKTLTVFRNLTPYVAVAHTAGDVITVKPLTLLSDIIRHMKTEIELLPNTIHGLETSDITFSTTKPYATLTAAYDPISIVAAWVDPDATYDAIRRLNLRLIKDLPSSVASTGYAVQIAPVPAYFEKSKSVRVVTSYRFDTSTWADALDLDSIGMGAAVQEIIQYGAAYRSLLGRASARVQLDVQGPARNAEEVTAQATLQMAESYRRTRSQMIAREASRLRAPYGLTTQ